MQKVTNEMATEKNPQNLTTTSDEHLSIALILYASLLGLEKRIWYETKLTRILIWFHVYKENLDIALW